MSSVQERGDIEEEYKWNLGSLFTGDEEWEEAHEAAAAQVEELEAFEGRATEDAGTLLELFEVYESVMRAVENVNAYARMRRDEDTRNDEAQAMATRAKALASSAKSAASFIEPERQAPDRAELEGMMDLSLIHT